MTIEAQHGCLNSFPGAALELTPDGVVRTSNGHLDALVGRELPGVAFDEVLDATSQSKWRQILSTEERPNPACTWELVVTTPQSLELRTFLAVWGGAESSAVLWLLEHSVDPKLELLYGELSELHRDLVEVQRELGRERTRLARALEKAEDAVRSRDDVLAVVSHDLRNPVSTITMAAGLLEMPLSEEQKDAQIGIIKRTADGMNRLIGDLLDVSAVESGRFRIELEPIEVAPVVDDSLRMMREKAGKKGQFLERQIRPDLPKVMADKERIIQVLGNLIGNAIKFTPEEKRITVRAEAIEGEVVVSIEDSGPGVSADDLPHIFDRFWHTSRQRRGGAGLGLAIAQGIVEAHGGRIWVDSPPGLGATFSFAIPLVGPSTGPGDDGITAGPSE